MLLLYNLDSFCYDSRVQQQTNLWRQRTCSSSLSEAMKGNYHKCGDKNKHYCSKSVQPASLMGICKNNGNECASVYLEGGEFHSFTQELKGKYICWNLQAFTQVYSRLTVWAQNPPANQRRGRAPHLQKRQTESERTRQQTKTNP